MKTTPAPYPTPRAATSHSGAIHGQLPDQVFENGKLLAIRLNVIVLEGFPAKYVDAVRAAAASCRVKKTLSDPPDVEVVVVSETERQVLSA